VYFPQILEQEKHVLRRRLDAVEGEHESKVSELQCDIAELRKCLEEQHVNLKSGERAKSTIIGQLTEQNQRLTAQLKEVTSLRLNRPSIPSLTLIRRPLPMAPGRIDESRFEGHQRHLTDASDTTVLPVSVD